MIEQDSKAQELKSDKYAKKVDEAAEVISLFFCCKKIFLNFFVCSKNKVLNHEEDVLEEQFKKVLREKENKNLESYSLSLFQSNEQGEYDAASTLEMEAEKRRVELAQLDRELQDSK